jgi:hypothetical protein
VVNPPVLRWGGFLDTVVEGNRSVLRLADTQPVAEAVGRPRGHRYDADAIPACADPFFEERFIDRIRAIVVID